MLRKKFMVCLLLSTGYLCAMPVDQHMDPNKKKSEEVAIVCDNSGDQFLDFDFDIDTDSCGVSSELENGCDFDNYRDIISKISIESGQPGVQVPAWVQKLSLDILTNFLALRRRLASWLGYSAA